MTYKQVFKIGDVVKALRKIQFMYGSPHMKGSLHLVQRQNEAYFNCNRTDYEKVIPKPGDNVTKHWIPEERPEH